MTLKIGSHLIAHNVANNQIYNTQIINITKTYYICKKLKTVINNEILYYTDDTLDIDRNFIKSFIDAYKNSKTLTYKKRFSGNNLYDDVYNVNYIKIPIHQ